MLLTDILASIGFEPNITLELPMMFLLFVLGVFLTWLIQKFTGGFDKRGD